MHTHQIKITDLHLTPIIGAYESERHEVQDVFLDILVTHTRPKVEDDLSTTFDYDPVVKEIKDYVRDHQPYLIETLAEAVVDIVLKNPLAVKVTVEVKKPQPLHGRGLVACVVEKDQS